MKQETNHTAAQAPADARYILAHDMGTSSDKAVLVDYSGTIVATAVEDYPTYYPNPAWVEQDPQDYWQAVAKASRRIIEENAIDPATIKGIVFSTQAQGIIPVAEDGTVLYHNITWVDGRAEKQAQSIMKKLGGKKLFTLAAGTPIMGKDCIAKIVWLKEERPEIYKKTHKILDVNGYLKYRLTGRMVTELSGASSYGLEEGLAWRQKVHCCGWGKSASVVLQYGGCRRHHRCRRGRYRSARRYPGARRL